MFCFVLNGRRPLTLRRARSASKKAHVGRSGKMDPTIGRFWLDTSENSPCSPSRPMAGTAAYAHRV